MTWMRDTFSSVIPCDIVDFFPILSFQELCKVRSTSSIQKYMWSRFQQSNGSWLNRILLLIFNLRKLVFDNMFPVEFKNLVALHFLVVITSEGAGNPMFATKVMVAVVESILSRNMAIDIDACWLYSIKHVDTSVTTGDITAVGIHYTSGYTFLQAVVIKKRKMGFQMLPLWIPNNYLI